MGFMSGFFRKAPGIPKLVGVVPQEGGRGIKVVISNNNTQHLCDILDFYKYGLGVDGHKRPTFEYSIAGDKAVWITGEPAHVHSVINHLQRDCELTPSCARQCLELALSPSPVGMSFTPQTSITCP